MKGNALLWILGGGVLAAVAMSKKEYISEVSSDLMDAVNEDVFLFALPSEAQPYADIIKLVAREQGLDPLLIAAIGQQESRWGQALSPPGPGGTGDGGHGRGIMQIDDRSWGDWLSSNDWTDPYSNVSKGARILNANISYFSSKGLMDSDLIAAAVAAYNTGAGNVSKSLAAGRSVDATTANGSYSSSVLSRLASFTAAAQSQLGLV